MTKALEIIDEQDAEEAQNLPAVRVAEAMVVRGEVTAEDVVGQRDKIKQVMDAVMQEGVHYGRIPGISKPTLLKPGAEVLAVTFRLSPSYQSERIFDGAHLTVISRARLTHIPSGLVVAEGEGLCSSRETKYAYRQQERTCPACGAATIIKGKAEYGGGWVCFKKKGGCGAKFPDGDAAIESQQTGRVENDAIPDIWNTVLKMANKRALVAAILNGTAASDIFTQDVEDTVTAAEPHERKTPARDVDLDLEMQIGELLGLSDRLGVREAAENAVEAHRGETGFAKWVQAQLRKAREAAANAEAPEPIASRRADP